ncbi:MAG: hypothetical protein IKZ51_01980 [Bacteroidales bacterium]|nr:hypothetical protein [Bacteroidales bacterium]
MFWDKRRTDACEVPMQALTIEHSFGLMPQCFFTLRSLGSRQWLPQAPATHVRRPAPGI